MRKKPLSIRRCLFCALAILSLLGSCDGPFGTWFAQKGSLTLEINEELSYEEESVQSRSARVLLPETSMVPVTYIIAGTGPYDASFNTSTDQGSKSVFDLLPGEWTISVDAYNASRPPSLIGSGSATTTVKAGENSNLEITVTPLDGTGSFNLAVDFSATGIANPQVEATLTAISGGSPIQLNFTVGGNKATNTSTSLPTGYYELVVLIKDGTTAKAGKADIVRIIKGKTTGGTFTFSPVQSQDFGSVKAAITPAMNNPLSVLIQGGKSIISVGDTLDLSAVVENSSEETNYSWYVNGIKQKTAGTTWSGGSNWGYGRYQIDLIAIALNGRTAGSQSLGVTVVPGELFGGSIQGRTLDLTGKVTTIAGSTETGAVDGIGTAARFKYPFGITTDGANLYITDTGSNAIRKVVISTGEVSTLAGGTLAPSHHDDFGTRACFNAPYGITTDGSYLYVVDTDNNCIRKIDLATTRVTTFAGSTGAGSSDGTGTNADFYYPNGITNDGRYLYVTEPSTSKIRRIEIATQKVETISASGDFNTPGGITTDGSYLYVSEEGSIGSIKKMSLETRDVSSISASFAKPTGSVVNGTTLYVADQIINAIRKIDLTTNAVTTFAGSMTSGSLDGIGTSAEFNGPVGITTDGVFLYVTDRGNNMLRRIE